MLDKSKKLLRKLRRLEKKTSINDRRLVLQRHLDFNHINRGPEPCIIIPRVPKYPDQVILVIEPPRPPDHHELLGPRLKEPSKSG